MRDVPRSAKGKYNTGLEAQTPSAPDTAKAAMDQPSARTASRVRPRRLGHGNFFVSDVQRAIAFYRDVCGFDFVFYENGIEMGFMTNGSSHHDFGLMQTMKAARIGRDGYVQPSTGRGAVPGLNHLGFEMESEVELIAAYRRAKEMGAKIRSTTDHGISRSVYIFDTEDNLIELYADTIPDWRAFYRDHKGELISGAWDPDAVAPSPEKHYVQSFTPTRVGGALFHPRGIARAALVAADYAGLVAFYRDVVGFDVVLQVEGDYCVLGSSPGAPVLAILARHDGQTPGLHHVGIELADAGALDASLAAVRESGISVAATPEQIGRRAFVIRDDDGFLLEFYAGDDRPDFGRACSGPARDYVI
jgi:catechol 2,3-dioxygenase